MDFELVAFALGDVTWITLAFAMGILSTFFGLPPLVGFLATGFMLNFLDVSSGDTLQKLADLGITLLLFTVGLKLNLRMLIRPQVWAVTLLHVGLVMGVFSVLIFLLVLLKAPLFAQLDFKLALLISFALSFSSTVFVVKVLEDKGDLKSLHGRIAIGILVMQDLIAVLFLAAANGKVPSPVALLLLLLIPIRPLFVKLLLRAGHGELLILYGLVLALGGAELFDLAGIKGDLGALIMGLLVSAHPKSAELAKSMLGFKDLFLVGFFLSIGISGTLSIEAFIIGLLLVPLMFLKSAFFFALLTRFKLRARTSLLATLNLSNYSEFGLIVLAIGVSQGWLNAEWLVVMAIALSVSFIISSPLNSSENIIYGKYRHLWAKFQNKERLPDDDLLGTLGAKIAIFGMGRVGSGAYDRMRELYGEIVVGIDFDNDLVIRHMTQGRNVLHGDPSDADFWDKLDKNLNVELVMLAMPNVQANLQALDQLKELDFQGKISATAKFPDDEKLLVSRGATSVFNLYTEAGTGFADQVAILTEMEFGQANKPAEI